MIVVMMGFGENYFFDDYADLNNWYTDELWIGREGYLDLTAFSASFSFTPGSELSLLGIMDGSVNDQGAWFSEIALFTNKTFTATAKSPFGFDSRQTWFDFLAGGTVSVAEDCIGDIYLIEHLASHPSNYKISGGGFPNFLSFFHRKGTPVNSGDSYIGIYIGGTEINLDLSTALRPDGIRTVDITSMEGFPNLTGSSNFHRVFRIVHDGNKIKLYINPDPNDDTNNNLPNEFLYLFERSVNWPSNLSVGYGQQSKGAKNSDEGYFHANYSNFIVKSAVQDSTITVTNSISNITIYSSAPEDTRPFVISFDNTINTSNAGINVVEIKKPSQWSNWCGITNITTNIEVWTAYDGSSSLKKNTTLYFSIDNLTNIQTNEVVIRTNGDSLWMRLGKQIVSSSSNKRIEVRFNMATEIDIPNIYTFDTYLEAVLFDPHRNQTDYSTCGPQKKSGTIEVIADPGAIIIDGFADLTPESIDKKLLGANDTNSWSFTLTVKAKTNNNTGIRYLGIMVPYEFDNHTTNTNGDTITNVWFANFESTFLGPDLVSDPIASNFITNGVTNKLFEIKYPDDTFTKGTVETVKFKVYTTNQDYPDTSPGGAHFNIYVDNYSITETSPSCDNDAYYDNLDVEINAIPTSFPWDIKFIRNVNYSPVSLGTTNTVAMNYFDVHADTDDPTNTMLTQCTVEFGGMNTEVKGLVLLYYDGKPGDGIFNAGTDTLVASNFFDDPSVAQVLSFNGADAISNFSTDYDNPARFWVALNITNTDPNVFTNTVYAKTTGLKGDGPGNGDFETYDKITNIQDTTARVDNHLIYVYADYMLSNNVLQSSFNNLVFKITFSNTDPDATNFFHRFYAKNVESASNDDFGYLKFFTDDDKTNASGNIYFDEELDPVIMAGNMNASKVWRLTADPKLEIGGITNVVLWAAFDVKLTADRLDKVAVKILDSTYFEFYHQYGDHSDARPAVIAVPGYELPLSINTNEIIAYDSAPWDYALDAVSYGRIPDSFTTNQLIEVGFADIYEDTEKTNEQNFIGAEVRVINSPAANTNEIDGWAYLYYEDSENLSFQTNDLLIGSNAVTDGQDFKITCLYSNVVDDVFNPDRIYLVFKLTGDIESAKSNTIQFQITNLLCEGPNGGLFDGTDPDLTNAINVSAAARIDSGRVVVEYISNYISDYIPNQGEQDNLYLKIGLRSDDPDATNFLSYIDVITNSNSTINISHVPYVRLYTNEGGDSVVSTKLLSGATRISLIDPVVLPGTGVQDIFIGYDIASSDPASVEKTFGLEVKANAFGFDDLINDGFVQYAFADGTLTGPSTATNIMIGKLNPNVWDFEIQSANNNSPQSIDISNIYAMYSFDIIADAELPTYETLTNISVVLEGKNTEIYGSLSLYRDIKTNATLNTTVDKYITNIYISDPANVHNFSFTESSITNKASAPTRFWVALEITNSDTAVYTNTIKARVSGIQGTGPDNVVSNTNKLTDITALTARVDDYKSFIRGDCLSADTIKQGSNFFVYFKLNITNSDPDATNYLYTMAITNLYNADSGDLGTLRLFSDTNDGVFGTPADYLVGSAELGTDNRFVITFDPALPITGSNLFWGTINVDYTADPDHSIALQIDDVQSSITFSDEFDDDDYTLIAGIYSSGNVPASVNTNGIIPSSSQDYDFALNDVGYNNMPVSFTTNQLVEAGFVDIYEDTERTNQQVFKGTAVRVVNNPAANTNDIDGWAYLYLENTGNYNFATNDTLIGSNSVTDGQDFVITCAYSNIAYNSFDAERIYLVFKLTGDITTAMSNSIQLQMTNLFCLGPNGGVFANIDPDLTNTIPDTARIDSFKVRVNYISNYIDVPRPKQGTRHHTLLKLNISSEDPNATNYLSHVWIYTNGLSTAADSDIASVKLYLDTGNGEFSNGNDTQLALNEISSGQAQLELNTPLEIESTASRTFFVTYDVGDSESVIGKKFGILVRSNSFGFDDMILADDFPQIGFVNTNKAYWPDSASNTIFSSFSARTWDFKVTEAENAAPVSIDISNLFAQYYFEIIGDGEIYGEEEITNISITFNGNCPDLHGEILLYQDIVNESTLTTNDLFITNASFTDTSLTYELPVSLLYITNESLYAPRFWIGIRITNDVTDIKIFSNTISARVTDIKAKGPNSGLVTNETLLSGVANKASQLDNYKIFITGETLLTNSVEQGSFDIVYFKLIITNYDLDATNFLSYMNITNLGNAGKTEMGTFQLLRDAGTPGEYDQDDELIGTANMNTNNVYNLICNPPAQIVGASNIMWGVFNVNFGAQEATEISLQIVDANSTNILFFKDNYADDYTLIPSVYVPNDLPLSITTNVIIPYDSREFDFILNDIKYDKLPQSFTTNEFIQVAKIDMFMDTENTNDQWFNGVDVVIGSSNYSNDTSGIAYIYKETNGDGIFSNGLDELIASTNVTGGQPFVINCNYPDIVNPRSSDDPDSLYLVFKLTNDILAAMDNTVYFRVTNLRCSGPDSGIFTNLSKLSAESKLARIDYGEVKISLVSNRLIPFEPKQSSPNNTFLEIKLQSIDPDAEHYLTGITIATNGKSQIPLLYIPALRVYNSADSRLLIDGTLGSGSADLECIVPFKITNTNDTILHVKYDISSSPNVTNQLFGLMIPQNAFTFADNIYDDFPQISYATNPVSPVVQTNVRIKSFKFEPYDVRIVDAVNKAPKSIGISNIYGISYLDVICDENELKSGQRLTNFSIAFDGKNSDAKGEILIYRSTNVVGQIPSGNFSTNNLLFITNKSFTSASGTNTISVDMNNFSQDVSYPTRIWIAIDITNNTSSVFTNTIKIKTIGLKGFGPDSGSIMDPEGILSNIIYIDSFFNPSLASKIDTFEISVDAEMLIDTNYVIRQSSDTNQYFKLIFNNNDTDATNWLETVRITNLGTAVDSDFQYLRLFKDTGNGVFNIPGDSEAMAGTMNSDVFNLTANPPVTMSGPSNIFFALIDIEYSAVTNNTIELHVPTINDITFYDNYSDPYDQRPSIESSSFPLPVSTVTLAIQTGQYNETYDFFLLNVSYKPYTVNKSAHSFTTNQPVVLGYVDIYQDTENILLQRFTGMDVKVTSKTNRICGIASLYLESSNAGYFAENEDTVIGSTNVINGNSFTVRSSLADVTTLKYPGDRIYLVFEWTNDIDYAKNDTIQVKITNLHCIGNQSMFASLGDLDFYESEVIHADKYEVNIVDLTTNYSTLFPNQGMKKNSFLKISMQGQDTDVTNYLDSVYVITNDQSTIISGNIPMIHLYRDVDGNGFLNTNNDVADSDVKDVSFNSHSALFQYNNPFPLVGTNLYSFFVAYDVDSAASVINKKVGFDITNNSILFTDGINDGFDQIAYATGETSGPPLAEKTNALLKKLGAYDWDLIIQDYQQYAPPPQCIKDVEIPFFWFKIKAEVEVTNNLEYLTAINITNLYTNYEFSGWINLYTNVDDDTFTENSKISSNYITHSNEFVKLSFETNYPPGIEDIATQPEKFLFTFTPSSFDNRARNMLKVISINGSGPNETGPTTPKVNGLDSVIISPSYQIFLENNYVNVTFEDLLPERVQQGHKDIPAVKLNISADDEDATFTLNNITFNLSNAYSNDIFEGKIFLESGEDTSGYDSADILKGDGKFYESEMTATFDTGVAIDKAGEIFYLLIEMGKYATVDNLFQIHFDKEKQSGFSTITIADNDYNIFIHPLTEDTTKECLIKEGVTFETPLSVKIGNTVFKSDEGVLVNIFLSPDSDYTKHTIYIYTMHGYKVRTLNFPSHKLTWDGKNENNEYVLSGMYIVVLKGPQVEYNQKVLFINNSK
ncbi:hypothetical protein ACFL6D_00620 [Spirochaetota bacterium]